MKNINNDIITNKRIDKVNYYLDIAEAVSERGTCLRKNFGCIIVKNDEIIATGYTGAPRGRKNCIDLGYCTKKEKFPEIHHGGYDACRSVHAEQNAMLSVARRDMIDATMYLVGKRVDTKEYEKGANSCQMCRKLIINAGIKELIIRESDKDHYCIVNISDWIKNDDLLSGKCTY